MGSQVPLQLPTIDFSNINKHDQGTLIWNSTKDQVFKAFQEYGCFEASFNEISPDLRNTVFASLKQLFNLPLETKLKNVPDKLFNGYVGQNKNAPLYESLGIEDPESFTNLMWPHGNHEFCNYIQSYIEKLTLLDQIVRMMVLESLNLEKYLEEHMELTNYLLRVMTYRVPKDNESNVGLNGHADKNILTILHQNEVGGLEVQNDDEEWIKAKVSRNCFVVMAGETFNIWTNGRLRAAFHRVVMNGEGTRYSIGLFAIPKWGKFVKAPEEMVDEEHPLLFKPFDYGEFVKFYYKKENIGNKFVMKEYCGVSS
ncbi:hypothetical protein L1887_03759 [Cichorium endivia]|nr:hypothetical protein L1887_03759 [Cichorium endivia]